VTGRELAAKVPLTVKLGSQPAMVAEGVTLSNASWGSRPDLARVRKLTLFIDPVALFLGEIKIGRLLLEGADILVEPNDVGDTNLDNQLSVGETWQYTASHTVTQNDIDTLGGGDGLIDNTVTADSAQTTPVSANASVVVESGASVNLVKTADVSSVDAAGDVINYSITVTNTGNTTLTRPLADDFPRSPS